MTEPKNESSFDNFMRNSKIVNKKGDPLVLYHGTDRSFESFWKTGPFGGARSRTQGGKLSGTRQLFYFTNSPEIAAEFAGEVKKGKKESGPNVIPVYLCIKNPLVLDAKGGDWRQTHQAVLDAYDQKDHDGVIIKNTDDGIGPVGLKSDVYVAFSGKQIKSIYANKENGFDANDDLINNAKNALEWLKSKLSANQSNKINPLK